jgi:hypothetical protein
MSGTNMQKLVPDLYTLFDNVIAETLDAVSLTKTK